MANQVAAFIMEKLGHIVFSPISHSHPIDKYVDPKNSTHRFWLSQDKPWVELCDEVWVLDSPYWKRSIGVRFETRLAHRLNKKVRLMFSRRLKSF